MFPRSKVPNKKTVPKNTGAGSCSRCRSVKSFNESISCNLCGELFHALCPNEKGRIADESICPESFLGSINCTFEKRWGYFVFFCNKCTKTIKSISSPSKASPMKDAVIQTDTEVHKETAIDSQPHL